MENWQLDKLKSRKMEQRNTGEEKQNPFKDVV
jgi:hypothetical protein